MALQGTLLLKFGATAAKSIIFEFVALLKILSIILIKAGKRARLVAVPALLTLELLEWIVAGYTVIRFD